MVDGFKSKIIQKQKSLGDVLCEARKKKEITLEKAESETKIRLKYIKAIEKNNFSIFSAEVYLISSLSRYATYLGLDKHKIIDRFKTQQSFLKNIKENKKIIEFKKTKPESPFIVNNPKKSLIARISISPQTLFASLVCIFVVGILGYIWFQVKSFAAAPSLELINQSSEIVVSLEKINIEGKTDPSASISINSEIVGVESDGHFKQEIKLAEGLNTIEIIARNKANKESKKTVQVLAKF